jgi:xylan 1,4-beta-xylosidase
MWRLFLMCAIFLITAFSCNSDITSEKIEQFTNPILAGFYPDPSICSVNGNYYLVNSTFAYFPGIPVFHSKDLVNWKLIGHVLDRPEQLQLSGFGVSRGLFAPAISHNMGIYYVVCTLVDGGGNFVVTANKAQGPWSNPVWIPQINGIDPSLFFDDDGKSYIVYNSIPPDNKPLYDGHRTIRIYEFDLENLKVSGEEILLVNGGTDIRKKPVWIEAPHIYKINDYYYLMCAEGGTAEQHSEVIFRSKSIDGPYIPYEKNPILTQRHLDPKRKNAITCTGHADLIQTTAGDWWAVFLGCRPYAPFEEGFYNTGRETFLAPVGWENGWPVINPDYEEVQFFYPYPLPRAADSIEIPYSGNFTIKDDFNAEILDANWLFLRTPIEKWFNLKDRKGFLAMNLRPENCADSLNPSFIGHRQQHINSSATISLDFNPQLNNEKAGILIFQNEKHFYFLCKSLKKGNPVVQLYRSDYTASDDHMILLASQKLETEKGHLFLKITSAGDTYTFSYATQIEQWNLLMDKIDARFLSTRIAGGFVGCVYALYSISLGKACENVAYFDWFEYQGADEIYK